jgi:hypothetical protein
MKSGVPISRLTDSPRASDWPTACPNSSELVVDIRSSLYLISWSMLELIVIL